MNRTFHLLSSLVIIIMLAGLLGCSSSGGESVIPPSENKISAANGESHFPWGLWQFTADPSEGTLDVVQLRTGNFHLNAMPFLEPPPLLNLTLETLKFNGNIIETDIGLRHPFLGLTEFTGFDVCGIFITNGSVTGFGDPDLRMAGEGDTRLLNPDGYSRWWNPTEFPHGSTMFSYKDGLLGAPDSSADFNSTLNAYKYFCDDLTGPNDPLDKITLPKRGMFSPGQKNIRHYTIDMGSMLIFNYAVDANWVFPSGQAPWHAPDDFAPEANRPEPYRIEVTETDNTLWNDGTGSGGNLSLSIDVYDWFNAGLNKVKVDSPGNFDPVLSSTPVGGGDGFSTYQIDITDAGPASGSIDLLITVESEVVGYQDMLPGKPVSAYFVRTSQVSGENATITVLSPNGGEVWYVNSYHDITWKSTGDIVSVKIEYSKDGFAGDIQEIIASTENDGTFKWKIPDDPSTTVRVRVSDASSPPVNDISDNDFTIEVQTATYWNQFMHDPRHWGRTNVAGPQTANFLWTHADGYGGNPLCVVEGFDGTIYYGCVTNAGKIWAVNPDGSTKWTYNPSVASTWAKPLGVSTDDSVVYVGINTGSFDGKITGVNTSNGNELWIYDAWDSANTFGLILEDGDLVAGVDLPPAGAGEYATIRIDQDGKTVWSKLTGFNWCTAPAQGPDGTIYIKGAPPSQYTRIYSMNPDTGDTINNYIYPSDNMQTSLAVRYDGKIVFGTNTMVYCLNTDMTLAWSCPCPGGILVEGIGVGLNDEIYPHNSSNIFAIDASGTSLWTKPCSVSWMSPAIGPDGTIYVGTSSGVAALDPTTGDPKWSYSLGGWACGPIIAHDGSLYVNAANKLRKFGAS